jgi:SAM-dependent methyltransferase
MSDPSTDFAASRDELRDTYARRFAGHEQRRKQIWEVLNRHFFERWVEPDDTVLDLGAGYCEFINSVRARQKFALDLNPATSQQAAPGVRVISQDITEQWAVEPASVDVVFTSNFLEHLPAKKNLTHCLQEASRILRPGGRFIALVPTSASLFANTGTFSITIFP